MEQGHFMLHFSAFHNVSAYVKWPQKLVMKMKEIWQWVCIPQDGATVRQFWTYPLVFHVVAVLREVELVSRVVDLSPDLVPQLRVFGSYLLHSLPPQVPDISAALCDNQRVSETRSGGSRVSQIGWGCQPIIWPAFSRNCMKIKEIGPGRGRHASLTPLTLGPANDTGIKCWTALHYN